MRDDFRQPVKEQLAKRVGIRCSNPNCRKQTSGPQSQDRGAVNIGVAAHITAAAQGGPRYDNTLTPNDRSSADNGIWLCEICAKLIDADPTGYPDELLRDWKGVAEATALLELKGMRVVKDNRVLLVKIESDLPDLLEEMRSDLKEHPFHREFILLKRGWAYTRMRPARLIQSLVFAGLDPAIQSLDQSVKDWMPRSSRGMTWVGIGATWYYNAGGQVTLSYYFEDHQDLRQKIRILENHGLVQNITHTNVERFSISEELADYLKAPN